MTTPQQQEYIDLLVPGAQQAMLTTPGVYASVCIAQAILETGWGKNTFYNNHHGIKWFGAKTGPFPEHVTGARESRTIERRDQGGIPIYAYFRTYASPLGSCLDWASNLKATRAYADAGAWDAADAENFAHIIGPVYTGGDVNYPKNVVSIMRDHNLTQYDLEGTMTRTLRGFTFNEESYWTFLALEELARLEGWVKNTLDIYQAIGGSSKSGGTHLFPGGAVDCWQSTNPTALLFAARNGGFPGWWRKPEQGFGHHLHLGVKGLPNRPYNYQISALLAGYNGLGSGGRSSKDDGPRAGVEWRNWEAGLKYLRDRIERKKREIESATTPALPREMQRLTDFWNPWLAVDAWDADNPEDATLTGLSDEDLHRRFVAHGFTFYQHATLHENMRFCLADLAGGWALPNIERKPHEVAWDLLKYLVAEPPSDITWVELRPVFDAAHSGGGFGHWGPDRVKHSVRAVQAGLNQLSGATLIPEDGIYGPTTRGAVSNFQVELRGAAANTAASDGVVGVHDFLHLVNYCTAKTGRLHQARFLY